MLLERAPERAEASDLRGVDADVHRAVPPPGGKTRIVIRVHGLSEDLRWFEVDTILLLTRRSGRRTACGAPRLDLAADDDHRIGTQYGHALLEDARKHYHLDAAGQILDLECGHPLPGRAPS